MLQYLELYTRKCGAGFRYPTGGCGMPLLKIYDIIHNTQIEMRYWGTE